MKRSELILGLLRIPLDALAVLAALLLSYRLRQQQIDLIPNMQLLEPATTLPLLDWYVSSFVLPALLLFLIIAAFLKLYVLRARRPRFQECSRVLGASLLWLVIVMAWYFLVEKQLFYSRILLIHSTLFIGFFVVLARIAVFLIDDILLRSGVGIHQILSIGAQPLTRIAQETLEQDRRYDYIGHVHDLEGVQEVANGCLLDLVIQTDPNPTSEDTVQLIDYCRSQHIGYAFFPPVLTDVPHMLAVERLDALPLVRFKPTPLDGWGHVCKRIFDVIIGSILILFLLPIFLLIALGILVESGLPIFYISQRVGKHGRSRIPVLKFRSMIKDADAKKQDLSEKNQRTDGPLFKMHNDPRVTKFGHFLRRFDFDELPQLFNVILGHMSLVGPRPHLPEEVACYHDQQRRVFAVRPGMTGLAQISGRSDLSFEEEVRFDLQYVEEWSPVLDLIILIKTVWVVLAGNGKAKG